jgi:hypothetical protein
MSMEQSLGRQLMGPFNSSSSPTGLRGTLRPWFWVCLCAGVVGSQLYLWATQLPLGIPGEWTWSRSAAELDSLVNMIGVLVAAVLYVAFVEWGAARLSGPAAGTIRTVRITALLAGLVGASFAWLWIVQEAAPVRSRLGKSAFLLYYPGSSGYFTKSRYEEPDAASLLAGYEALMRERDVLHVGTHPPGLFLIFHGLIRVCQQPSSLATYLDATQPRSFRDACDVIAGNSVRSVPPRPLLPADRRVLWLATLIVLACASLAVVPLYVLIRRTGDAAAAWRAAALWPAIPAVAAFVPKSDVAFAFLGLLMVCAWLAALDRRSTVLAFLTGLLVWCGLMLSLAFLPVLLFMAIAGWRSKNAGGRIAEDSSEGCASDSSFPRRRESSVRGDVEVENLTHAQQKWTTKVSTSAGGLKNWLAGSPPVLCVIAATAGFVIPTLLLGWCCRINMLSVWWLNYQNHSAFYSQYPRTYWKWLLENPVELAFAGGWPVMLLSAGFVWGAVRSRSLTVPPVIGVVVVWGILWLTGKNSGEAARLWIVFLPWLVWLAGLRLAEIRQEGTREWLRPATVILSLQLLVCALTVARVSGFEF